MSTNEIDQPTKNKRIYKIGLSDGTENRSIRDEIVKRTRQPTDRRVREEEDRRGQGFSGRERAGHGNKTRRTLISDSENREHEPWHGTRPTSLSFSFSFSLVVGLRGP